MKKQEEYSQDKTKAAQPRHDCYDFAVPYESDGALGHGWECSFCGEIIQVG